MRSLDELVGDWETNMDETHRRGVQRNPARTAFNASSEEHRDRFDMVMAEDQRSSIWAIREGVCVWFTKMVTAP